jgi:hypothetical protein
MNMKAMTGMMALSMALVVVPAAAGIQVPPGLWRFTAMETVNPDAGEGARAPATESTKPLPRESSVPPLDKPDAARPAAAEAPPNGADKTRKKPVPKPVAVEPLTPEQATHKAADPKAPSGALIVKPKPTEELPAPAAGAPAPPAPAGR